MYNRNPSPNPLQKAKPLIFITFINSANYAIQNTILPFHGFPLLGQCNGAAKVLELRSNLAGNEVQRLNSWCDQAVEI